MMPHGFGRSPLGLALDARDRLDREHARLAMAIGFERFGKVKKLSAEQRKRFTPEAEYIANHPAMRNFLDSVAECDARIAELRASRT